MLSRFIERIRKSRRRGRGLDSHLGGRQRSLTAEPLEDRRLLALLTDSPGDATLDVDVDGFGGFNSAFYDPVGTPTRGDTTFDSFVALGFGGNRTSPTGNITSSTDTEVRSTADYQGLHFEITQTISPLTEGTARVGTLLTQTYLMSNTSAQTLNYDVVRYIDGDLYLTNTSLADGGGRTVVDGHDILFETDGVIQSTDVDTFLGIAAEGGTVPTNNRFEISSYSGLLGTVNAGGALDDQVQGAPNNESFITNAYDVTLALRNEYSLAPGEDTYYVTWTFFGTLSPDAIQVPTGGSVTGTKFNDSNADGVQDESAGEVGLSGWQIFLDANDNGELDDDELSTTTDNEGVYVFEDVEPGDYQVREVPQTGWTQYFPAANGGHDVTVTLGTVATDRDFGNRFDGATISGVKFMDLNGNGRQEESEGEIGLAGWTIWADLDDDGTLTVADAQDVTRADGSYNITVPPGTYTIREVEQANWTQTAPSGGGYTQDFEALTSYPGRDFGNDPDPLVVTGFKWNDLNGNGERDASEQPFAGVKIFADLDENGQLNGAEPWTESQADGTYTLEVDFGPGTFQIAEEPSSSYNQTYPDPNVSRYYLIVGEPGDAFGDRNFGNQLKPGSITGVKWNDLNGNRVRDNDASGNLEPGLAGVTIYIDLNNDRQLSLGEPATTTLANGSYRIGGLQPGEYYVREDARSGSSQTYPNPSVNGGSHYVTVTANTATINVDFGNQPRFDYGDAPSSYFTSGAGAAVHEVLSAYYLGATIDGEEDGQPGTLALGDNVNGTNDEDGVVFTSELIPGQTATLTVTFTQAGLLANRPPQGFLQGWIDFNGNGSFADAGEQIIVNRTLVRGGNPISFTVPAWAVTGQTYARFRLGFEYNLGFSGPAIAGEVEDYRVQIGRSTVWADQIGVRRGNQFLLDVDGNGRWTAGDRVVAFGLPSDTPLTGDWNGDGRDEIGVRRGNRFLLDYDGNGQWTAGVDRVNAFGLASDTPLIGDWNDDGTDEIGVRRGNRFLLDYDGNGQWTAGVDLVYAFGRASDTPLIGDWNGDGDDEIGVRRGNQFLLDYDGNGQWTAGMDRVVAFGLASDTPLIGDWNDDGTDEIGVRRGNQFLLDYDGNGQWTTGVDRVDAFGRASDTPLIGDWSLPLVAAGGHALPDHPVAALTRDELAPILQYAADVWSEAPLTAEQERALSQVQVQIADLAGARLGQTRGTTIALDIDAAGYGWFVDATPWSAEEYGLASADGRTAAGRMDLLSAVMHEIGHVLGYAHDEGGVMQEQLAAGTRPLWADTVDNIFTGEVGG